MKRFLLLLSFLFIQITLYAQNIAIDWDKTYGGDRSDSFAQLVETQDGGYLVVASSDSDISEDKSENSKGSSDFWVLKLDGAGNKIWDKTLGGSEYDGIRQVIVSEDGGYLLLGSSDSSESGDKTGNSRGLRDGWVIKLDGNGDVQWDSTIGGSGNDYLEKGLSLSDGGYLLGGFSDSDVSGEKSQNSKGSFDYWIIKLDENGKSLWDRTIGGTGFDNLVEMSERVGGGYLLAGNSSSSISGDKSENSRGEKDYWIVGVDEEGHYMWDKTYGGSSADLLMSMMPANDGGFILAGDSSSTISGEKSERAHTIDYWVLKIDASGNLIWDKTIAGNSRDMIPFVCASNDGNGYLLAGNSDSGIGLDKSEVSRGQIDFWVVKIDEQGNKIWDKTLGGNSDDLISSIVSTTSGYILGGRSASGISGEKTENPHSYLDDLWIIKIRDVTPSISGFTLINAEEDEDILTLTDGDVINLSELPTTLLNIRANTSGNTSKVLLEISGALTNSRSEGVAPYALYGDTSGDYNAQKFAPGDYTLIATPFAGSDQGGSEGTPLTVRFSMVETASQAPFVTTWKTDNPGTSANNQITIPVSSEFIYNYEVDWGDGNIDAGITGSITHTYSDPGTYTVKIQGVFPQPYFVNGGDKEKLLSIDQWGEIQWESMLNAFHGCSNLELNASDIPDFSKVQNTQYMFRLCGSMQGHSSMSLWNMSNVTTMDFMFREAGEFNQDISGWDVAQVKSMIGMFSEAHAFNSPLSNWDVSKVENMDRMFSNALLFNQPIGNWDVGAVTNMGAMFFGAQSFNQDIGNWNVGNVQNMIFTFGEAIAFNQDLSAWNLSSAIDISFMFADADSFNSDISQWNTSNIRYMNNVFSRAVGFDQNLSSWDVTSVESMIDIFNRSGLSRKNYDAILNGWSQLNNLQSGVTMGAGTITYCTGKDARQNLIDSNGWDITDGGEDCPGNLPFITRWKTDNPGKSEDNQITIPTYPGETYNYTVDWGDGTSDSGVTGDITHTYANAGTYRVSISGEFPQIFFHDNDGLDEWYPDREKILSIDQWGSIQWKSMNSAFHGCLNLDMLATDVPDLTQVTSLAGMFNVCPSLAGNESFRQWNVSNIKSMAVMFGGTNLFNVDIGNWDVHNVLDMTAMFLSALSFNQDIGNWDVSNVTGMSSMFLNAQSFNQDLSGWDVSNVTHMASMFQVATSFDQSLSNWDVSRVTDMRKMFTGVSLSVENYDALLSGWANLPFLQNGVSFDAGNSEYCMGIEAHLMLTGKYGWSVSDGGTSCQGPDLAVTRFVLVNADSDEDIMFLSEGQVINVATLPTMNLDIRADATEAVSSIRLSISGNIVAQRTENVMPYAMFGDSGGNYSGNLFSTGSYILTGTPFSEKDLGGNAGTALSVSFVFDESTPDCRYFGVISAGVGSVTNCNQPNGFATVEVSGATGPVSYSWSHDEALNEPEAYNLDVGKYTLTYSDTFCSKEITFEIEAKLPEVSLPEFDDLPADASPIMLGGGLPEGGTYSGPGVDNGLFDPSVGPGIYEIIYSYENANGCTNSATQSITVIPVSLAVTSLTLVDADSDSDLLTLEEGLAYDLSNLPTNFLNIRANSTSNAGSVILNITGAKTSQRNENVAPYALFGDTNGNYNGNEFTEGSYTVTAVPYSGPGGTGQVGESVSISFTLFQSGTGKQATVLPTKGYELAIHPNSASTSVNVSLTDSSVKIKSILVHDLSGRKVGEFNAQDFLQGTDYVLPVYQYQSGIYLITTIDSNGTINQERLSVQN